MAIDPNTIRNAMSMWQGRPGGGGMAPMPSPQARVPVFRPGMLPAPGQQMGPPGMGGPPGMQDRMQQQQMMGGGPPPMGGGYTAAPGGGMLGAMQGAIRPPPQGLGGMASNAMGNPMAMQNAMQAARGLPPGGGGYAPAPGNQMMTKQPMPVMPSPAYTAPPGQGGLGTQPMGASQFGGMQMAQQMAQQASPTSGQAFGANPMMMQRPAPGGMQSAVRPPPAMSPAPVNRAPILSQMRGKARDL